MEEQDFPSSDALAVTGGAKMRMAIVLEPQSQVRLATLQTAASELVCGRIMLRLESMIV
jgi:hypothetical protein